jgi:hypothetical protein
MIKAKNKQEATLRAFIAGFLGANDFYLKKYTRGIFRAVSSVVLALVFARQAGFGQIIIVMAFLITNISEGLKLFFQSQHDFDVKYNPHLFIKKGENDAPATGIADEILKLNQLFEKGLITFEEFEKKKAKLLG